MKNQSQIAIEAIQIMKEYEQEIEDNVKNKTVTPFQEGFRSGMSWCRTLIRLDTAIKNMPDKKTKKTLKNRRRFI